jgi:hypothetical protein
MTEQPYEQTIPIPDPYKETSYFNQQWAKGTLSKKQPGNPVYIDEIRNPTNISEKTYANSLQNYYIYEPLNPSSDSILKLTSFYKPNPELFNILEVFKPLDQGHDFYTSKRNTKEKNWTLPSPFEYIQDDITKEDDIIKGYNRCQCNTSFGGGKNIFGLIYIEDNSYEYLKGEQSELDINKLLDLIKLNNVNEDFSIYGLKINFTKSENELNLNTFENSKNEYTSENGDILFLTFYKSGVFDNGMHNLWNFNNKSHVYAVYVDKIDGDNNMTFKGYKLYDCDNIIPEIHIDIKNIFDKYIDSESDLKKYIQGDKKQYSSMYKDLFKKIYNSTDGSNKQIIEKIMDITKETYEQFQTIKRGNKLIFYNYIDNKDINDFFVGILLRYFYSILEPTTTENYNSCIKENQEKIKKEIEKEGNQNTNIPIYKLPVSVIDANTGPKESIILQNLRSLDNLEDIDKNPYKYSIVSINVDGSGLGGQIFPSYHPPEISIYMTIFDSNNKFHGFIYRICFLKKINSNVLNAKAKIEVDMHYCFFNPDDFNYYDLSFNYSGLSGENIDKIQEAASYITDYILNKTKVEEKIQNGDKDFALKTDEKEWKKFSLISDAPSVLEINTAVYKIDKKQNIFSNIYNSIVSLATSRDDSCIQNIIKVATHIYKENEDLFKDIIDRNDFIRTFLVRNKYIGDNSRATDTLYYNKEMIIDGIQLSNDENTLTTAMISNVSSVLAGPNSPKCYFYIAPYLTSNQKYISSKKTDQISSEIEKLNENQESTGETAIKIKVPKRPREDVSDLIIEGKRQRGTRTTGGRSLVTQNLTQDVIQSYQKQPYETKQYFNKSIKQEPLQIELENVAKGPVSQIKQESISRFTPENISESRQGTQNNYLNNLIEYLKYLSESISYILSTFTDESINQGMNDFIVKLYLIHINKNISTFSKGLTIQNILDEINTYTRNTKPTLEEGLYIKNTYNSIFNDFDRIKGLILTAQFIQEDIDEDYEIKTEQTGGSELSMKDFESIFNKLNNLFYFTQNRLELLNISLNNVINNNVIDNINFYNYIILKLYDYLSRYYNNLYTIDYNDANIDSFVGIYCFFMYFTIEFNKKLNEQFDKEMNGLDNYFLGNQLHDWTKEFVKPNNNIDIDQENSNNILESIYESDINSNLKKLNYSGYIDFSKNDISNILKDLDPNRVVFMKRPTRKQLKEIGLNLATTTAYKSLYFLLDDNFICNYYNYKIKNISNIKDFLIELFDTCLYGLINKTNYEDYINDKEFNEIISQFLESTKTNETIIDCNIVTSTEKGGTLKNKKKIKHNNITKNKKHKNKNKKTIKKRVKKIIRYSRKI